MRSRHFPRLCQSCQAPLARQEVACWQCGTRWASQDGPRPNLRVIAGGLATQATAGPAAAVAVAAETGDDGWPHAAPWTWTGR